MPVSVLVEMMCQVAHHKNNTAMLWRAIKDHHVSS